MKHYPFHPNHYFIKDRVVYRNGNRAGVIEDTTYGGNKYVFIPEDNFNDMIYRGTIFGRNMTKIVEHLNGMCK